MIPAIILICSALTFLYNITRIGVDTEDAATALFYSLVSAGAIALTVLYMNGAVS